MTRVLRWKVPAAACLAMLSLGVAATGLLALSGAATPIEFADVHDRRAFDLLSRSSKPETLNAAEAEVRQALRLSPYNNSARLRLTYIDTVRHGGMTQVGMTHLARSYDLVPLDHTVAAWRVKYALEHWRALTPDIRKAVATEALAFGSTTSRDADIRATLLSVQNPEGRVAAALWKMQLAY